MQHFSASHFFEQIKQERKVQKTENLFYCGNTNCGSVSALDLQLQPFFEPDIPYYGNLLFTIDADLLKIPGPDKIKLYLNIVDAFGKLYSIYLDNDEVPNHDLFDIKGREAFVKNGLFISSKRLIPVISVDSVKIVKPNTIDTSYDSQGHMHTSIILDTSFGGTGMP